MREIFITVLKDQGISKSRVLRDLNINLYIDRETITLDTIQRICTHYGIEFGLYFSGKVYSLLKK